MQNGEENQVTWKMIANDDEDNEILMLFHTLAHKKRLLG